MYEIYEKLLKIKGIKSSDVSKTTGISNMTFSDWKNGKSTPKPDKLALIADYFGVTIDFLMGRTEQIKCNICNHSYNPLDEFDCAIHDMYHQKFLNAKEKFSFLIDDHLIARLVETEELKKFKNADLSSEKRIAAYTKYLEAKFSAEIGFFGYEIDGRDYEEFCKSEVSLLEPNSQISHDLILQIAQKYSVDIKMLDLNNKLLAKAIKNPRILNIVKYALEMDEEQLSYAEKTMKAFTSE